MVNSQIDELGVNLAFRSSELPEKDVFEIGGCHLTRWYTADGWIDSGWIRDDDPTPVPTFSGSLRR